MLFFCTPKHDVMMVNIASDIVIADLFVLNTLCYIR